MGSSGAATQSFDVALLADGNPVNGILRGSKWDQEISYGFTRDGWDYQWRYQTDFFGNILFDFFGNPLRQALYDVDFGGGGFDFSQPNGTTAQFDLFSPFNALQQKAAIFTLEATGASAGFSVEGFTNLATSEASDPGWATMRMGNSADALTAYGFFPTSPSDNPNQQALWNAGDIFIGYNEQGDKERYGLQTPAAGNYAWSTIMHEIGHALGLKHGHEQMGDASAVLPTEWDTVEFSIMTYTTYVGFEGTGYQYEHWGAPQTFMMLDIAALQHMYGADFSVNAGNTVYEWTPGKGDTLVDGEVAIDVGGGLDGASGSNRIFMTIWDGGGTDTYDFSAYGSGVNADLSPGSGSVLSQAQLADLGGGPNGGKARFNVYNAMQFEGDPRSLIENAIGGSGNDRISGNQAANGLTGGGGKDALFGAGGKDVLSGNGGRDQLHGNGGKDDLIGNGGRDKLWGDAGKDTLKGGGGKDKLFGESAKDKLTGGGGKDIFVFKAFKDSKLAKKKRDVITDFGGKDKIDLRKLDADKGQKGNQKFDFIGDKGLSGDHGELRYDIRKKKTFVYGDAKGGNKADFMIELKGKIKFDGNDFLL